MKNLASKRLRQLRLNLAYKKSDEKLNETLSTLVGGAPHKVHIRHHSHQLATTVKNAMRYNRNRTNGITVVVLESEALARPVYGYSVCSVEDTYSRLIGRTLAKENLIKNLTEGNAQVLPPSEDLLVSQSRDKQLHRYINHVVTQVAPRLKYEAPKPKLSRLQFINEASLNLEVKQLIAKKFGVNTKEIENHFVYLRRFNNKFFENQYATHANILKYADENPQDDVKLDSTGGFTLGVFLFQHEGVKHMVYAVTPCLIDDHYNKEFGRKSTMSLMKQANIFKDENQQSKSTRSQMTRILRLTTEMDLDVMLDQLALYAVGELYGLTVNTYVGGVSA